MKRYSGRDFSPEDLRAVARLIEANPTVKRTPLSRLVCELLDWRRPDGRLREMSCRVAMLRMQADGLITLPASQIPKQRRRGARPGQLLVRQADRGHRHALLVQVLRQRAPAASDIEYAIVGLDQQLGSQVPDFCQLCGLDGFLPRPEIGA